MKKLTMLATMLALALMIAAPASAQTTVVDDETLVGGVITFAHDDSGAGFPFYDDDDLDFGGGFPFGDDDFGDDDDVGMGGDDDDDDGMDDDD